MKPVFTSLIFFCLVSAQAQVAVQDSNALLALYISTNGDQWTDHTHWLSAAPVDTWYGVEVSDGRVYAVDLYSNNLTGTLPETIGNLTGLRRLNVANNDIEGLLPASMGGLKELVELYVYDNQFGASLPDSIRHCVKLKELLAAGNQFTGPFPGMLFSLTGLTRLELGSNQFTGSIPPDINTMVNLQTLALDRNNFSGPMPSIKALTALNELHLRENQLSGDLHDFLGDGSKLYYLTLGDNNFTGALEDSFFDPLKLTYLDAPNNRLTAIGDFSQFEATGVLNRITIRNNQIPFEFLEVNSEINQFYYSPQLPLLDTLWIAPAAGDSLTIFAGTWGDHTTYQWYHNGIEIPGAQSPYFTIENISPGDAGEYYSIMENSLLPGLQLRRNPVYVASITSVDQVRLLPLGIYPVPANEFITLENIGSLNVLSVSNALGIPVPGDLYSVAGNQVDISALTSGLYYLLVRDDNRILSGRFIKV